ncbi:MAG: hypothetical protein AAGG02_05835 [Cyanobacteria bacterium P01_H01_bin.15]
MNPTLPHPIFHQANTWFYSRSQPAPDRQELVSALLQLEKQSRQERWRFTPTDLHGTWRLAFVTGTLRSQKNAGKILGPGRFLPRWLEITIRYTPLAELDPDLDSDERYGAVFNKVAIAGNQLELRGPTELLTNKTVLAFDFTRLRLNFLGKDLLNRSVGGGLSRETEFFSLPIKNKVFFNYFWVSPEAIAARGKGGGLALWLRSQTS